MSVPLCPECMASEVAPAPPEDDPDGEGLLRCAECGHTAPAAEFGPPPEKTS